MTEPLGGAGGDAKPQLGRGLRDSTPEAEARAERDLEQLAREIAMDDGADAAKPWIGEDGG